MAPFDTYKIYIALKNHFTKSNYDYFVYCGKTKVNLQSFYKRKDRFFFEKISRQKKETEILNFFVANFVSCNDPQSLWIGEIIKYGEENYTHWQKRIQSLSYIFREEVEKIFSDKDFDQMFVIEQNKHPQILKDYLQGKFSLETLVILDRIIGYKSRFDKKLEDPIWEFVSMRMSKYSPFLNTDVFHYKKILKEVILGDK